MIWLAVALAAAPPRLLPGGAEAAPEVVTPLDGPLRRIPGSVPANDVPVAIRPADPGAIASPPVGSPAPERIGDRWRLVEAVGVRERWWDPYHQNTLKGDRPIGGRWFADVSLGADLGAATSGLLGARFSAGIELLNGDTAFRPPAFRLRAVAWTEAATSGAASGLRTAYAEVHLASLSAAWDPLMLRIGVQPVSAGPRGLVLRDAQPAVRLLGTAAANRVQYALGWVHLVSGVDGQFSWEDTGDRDEVALVDVVVRDLPRGLEWHLSAIGQARPDRTLAWAGLGVDGRIGRVGLTAEALGLAGEATEPVRAGAGLAEASVDVDWWRFRGVVVAASGDRDPGDGVFHGFAALREGTDLGGAELGWWRTANRGGVLAGVGWSEPAYALVFPGVGVDVDVLPTLRASADAALLVLDVPEGVDLSAGVDARPLFAENVVVRAGGGVLIPTGSRYDTVQGTASARVVLQW